MAKPSTYVAVSPTQRAGSLAEARALDYLCSQGLRPVAANVRLRPGEIDLIMADGGQCVFSSESSNDDGRDSQSFAKGYY